MAKRLYILRHAQALSAADTDRNRALSPKGVEDALALGNAMVRKDFVPDFVAVSPAVRTMQTFENIMQALPDVPRVSPDDLYNGMAGDLVGCIQDIDEAHENILLIAHNPGVHELAVWLTHPDHGKYLVRLAGYAPATLCVFDCACEKWADIQPHENVLVDVMEAIDYNAPARPTRWM